MTRGNSDDGGIEERLAAASASTVAAREKARVLQEELNKMTPEELRKLRDERQEKLADTEALLRVIDMTLAEIDTKIDK